MFDVNNDVRLIGRLTRDPEMRRTSSGIAVTRFTLAVSKKEGANFIDCVSFDRTAENIAKYCAKGREIAVAGELSVSDWTDKNGAKHRKYEVIAHVFKMFSNSNRETKDDTPDLVELDDPDDLPF